MSKFVKDPTLISLKEWVSRLRNGSGDVGVTFSDRLIPDRDVTIAVGSLPGRCGSMDKEASDGVNG